MALGLASALLFAVPGPAAADEVDAQEQPTPQVQGTETGGASRLALSVSPVIGDEPGDGDLVADPGTGLPTLTFSPSSPVEQASVFDFTVTNTGDVALSDVAISDDRIGVVLDAASGTGLAPGASTTVRAAATYTFEEAIAGTAGLVVTGARASATDGAGTAVEALAESTIQVVAVLPTPSATLDLEVLTDTGDVVAGVGGLPTVSWSAEEAAVGDERTIHYRLTVTNTGDVELREVAVVVEVLGATLDAAPADGVLAPGATTVLEVSHTITPDELGGDPAVGVEFGALATLEATDEAGQAVAATDDVVVLGLVVQPDELEEEEVLPAAGPREDGGELLVIAVLLLLLGADLLWVTRPRTAAAARPRPRRAGAPSTRG